MIETQRMQRRARALNALAALLVLVWATGLVANGPLAASLQIPRSGSIPLGLYARAHAKPAPGLYASFAPAKAWPGALEDGLVSRDDVFVKRVVGGEGDCVCALGADHPGTRRGAARAPGPCWTGALDAARRAAVVDRGALGAAPDFVPVVILKAPERGRGALGALVLRALTDPSGARQGQAPHPRPPDLGCQRVGEGLVLVAGLAHPRSLDSRYYGPVPSRFVTATWAPVATWPLSGAR